MRVVIIEDEHAAVRNLQHQLELLEPDIEFVKVMESVSEAIGFFRKNVSYDLVFVDIHLADGNSFEIFKVCEPQAPLIFTTAFHQYALNAFKLQSIDYLIKPVQEAELAAALDKFRKINQRNLISQEQIQALLTTFSPAPVQISYRKTYLVKKKNSFIPIAVEEFAYFFIENGVVRGHTHAGKSFHFEKKLEEFENELDPSLFFRINRQYLVQRKAIKELQQYFHGRLLVKLVPSTADLLIVSRANAGKIKDWLNKG